MEPYYRDFFRSRLELVDLIPGAHVYPLLYAGWMDDDHLLAAIPGHVPHKMAKYMQYCWFKAQLTTRLGPIMNLQHPAYYAQYIPLGNLMTSPLPMICHVDECLKRLGGPLSISMALQSKSPAAVECRLWLDELQALLWSRRLRPSDENTRMLFALYNHTLHNSQQDFKGHAVEAKCICTDCLNHNVACTCTNCLEHRKASLIASQVRHALLH